MEEKWLQSLYHLIWKSLEKKKEERTWIWPAHKPSFFFITQCPSPFGFALHTNMPLKTEKTRVGLLLESSLRMRWFVLGMIVTSVFWSVRFFFVHHFISLSFSLNFTEKISNFEFVVESSSLQETKLIIVQSHAIFVHLFWNPNSPFLHTQTRRRIIFS